ncbi:MAG: cold-shock protein [Candidatus Azotimanducaceae bacterium]
MATGTVKWFNNAKGYGFILPDGGGEDLFAHFSAIQMDGYKTLRADDPVEYEVVEGPKGLHADNIRSVAGSSGLQAGELSAHQEPSDELT